MEINIILAGVGGQGILTTAQAICLAALRRGLRVKQAEVHGMSQRGGAVESHLRVADHELYSDLIPLGKADMILAVEPMEALRYVQFLSENGVIIASSNPVVNIPNYGSVETVRDRVFERDDAYVAELGFDDLESRTGLPSMNAVLSTISTVYFVVSFT